MVDLDFAWEQRRGGWLVRTLDITRVIVNIGIIGGEISNVL